MGRWTGEQMDGWADGRVSGWTGERMDARTGEQVSMRGGGNDREALVRLLGGPETAWIVERLRRRLAAEETSGAGPSDVHDPPLTGSIVLHHPSDAQRAAAASLVGRPRRGGATLRIDVGLLDSMLRRGPWASGLVDAVVALTGPVLDPSAVRRREALAWERARDRLLPVLEHLQEGLQEGLQEQDDTPDLGERTDLSTWWTAWCAGGGLKRLARAEQRRLGCASPLPSPSPSPIAPGRLSPLRGQLTPDPPSPVLNQLTPDPPSPGVPAREPAIPPSEHPLPEVAADLVDRLAAVLLALPAPGEPLSVIARRAVGDAHALDGARPLGRLAVTVLGAWLTSRRPPGASVPTPSPRDVWAGVGVVMSTVASSVLCWGVPGSSADEDGFDPVTTPGSPGAPTSMTEAAATALALEAMRSALQPSLLTLNQVRSGGVPALPRHALVHVCENPTVVEVVAEQARTRAHDGGTGVGARLPVLVCTSGQPSTAVIELLLRLTSAGAECAYHGDFDWAGLRIATALGSRVPWRPWRFRATDYLELVRSIGPGDPEPLRLRDTPAESPWDPDLALAMERVGVAVEEEVVADQLAADVLGRGAPRT